jgi:phosphoglycerate dehydrogenase-like enzyme
VLSTTRLHPDAAVMLKGIASLEENPLPPLRMFTKEQLLDKVRDVDAVILFGEEFDREIILSASKLKIIARHGVGYQNIDLKAAAEKGIYVTYAPIASLTITVAEHAVALIFALARNLFLSDKYVRDGVWTLGSAWPPMVECVHGKVLGIVGLGRIGCEVARMATCLGMKVIYSNRTTKVALERELGIEYVNLDELLRRSDFVSICIALADDTRGMIGKRELNLMKKTAYLINVARGPVVDQDALYNALSSRAIAGAGLECFGRFYEGPPAVDDPILKLDNVVLTPHNSTWNDKIYRDIGITVVSDVLRVFRGEEPLNIVVGPRH